MVDVGEDNYGGGGGVGGMTLTSVSEYALSRSPGAMFGKRVLRLERGPGPGPGPPRGADRDEMLARLAKLSAPLPCRARIRELRAAVPIPAMLSRPAPNSATSSSSSRWPLSLMAPKLAVESFDGCVWCARSGSAALALSGPPPMSLAVCRCSGSPAATVAARAASRVDEMGSSDANMAASSVDAGSGSLGKSMVSTRVSRQPDGSPGSRLRYDT